MATTKKATKEAAPAAKTKAAQAPKAPTADALISSAGTPSVQKIPADTVDKKMEHLKLHGKEFVGIVKSDKAHKTVTVEWERRRMITKYERYEKRYSRVYAHNPLTINARTGDTVRIKETRPLSKTKNFVVVEIVRRAGENAEAKQ